MNEERLLPLFPLPGVVLFPGTTLPLHIYEPRYREMVRVALEGDRHIGMVLLKPGWQSNYAGRPPVLELGGAGEIVESEMLPDRRYNIVLEGRFRYRILEELPGGPFRLARTEILPSLSFAEAVAEAEQIAVATQLYDHVAREAVLPPLPREPLNAERLSGELANRLRYKPAERQELLETDSLADRFNRMMERMREWETRIEFLQPYRAGAVSPDRN